MKSFGVRSIAGMGDGTRDAGDGTRAAGDFASARDVFADTRLTYSHMPSRPPSRPKPLSRYPPNPAAASKRFVEFTHTTPAFSLGAMSSARLMLSVHTLAARPYG